MSLRYLTNTSGLLIISLLLLGLGGGHAAQAGTDGSSVETYTDQAAPVEPPSAQAYKNAPLPAGTLTLDDVLRAHKPEKREKTALPPTTGVMMTQGMNAVFQRYGVPPAPPLKAPLLAPETKTPEPSAPASVTPSPDSTPAPTTQGIVYQPGQEPKSLGETTQNRPTKTPSCGEPQKWEKTCSDAGYPSTFVGKVVGETSADCTDGSLHDTWVTNTCAPPDEALASKIEKTPETPLIQASEVTADTHGKESLPQPEERKPFVPEIEKPAPSGDLCGDAAEMLAYEAPRKNLCRLGVASAVNGDGPWTWTCTTNEGATSACQTLSLKSEEPPTPSRSASSSAPSESAKHFLEMPAAKASAKTAEPPVPSALPVFGPSCGTANGQTATEPPTAGLCAEGKASAVRGSNPWKWTCGVGRSRVSCATIKRIDGACGGADGIFSKARPTKKLCKTGTPSPVQNNGAWSWSCEGTNGGSSASCSAPATKTALEIPSIEENPIPTKSFGTLPTPSSIPDVVKIEDSEVPASTKDIEENAAPIQPPAVGKTIPPAPALQEPTSNVANFIPTKLVALDPTLSTILFSHGSESIETSVHVTLDKLATALAADPSARISLIAYADTSGLSVRNGGARRVALARGLAVRGYLTSKGVSESQIDIHAENSGAPSGYPDRVDVKINE